MRSGWFVLFLFFTICTFAQERNFIVKPIDRVLKQELIAGRYTVKDSSGALIATGFFSKGQSFQFRSDKHFVVIRIDSTVETCDGQPFPGNYKVDLDTVRDTIRFYMAHLWIDYNLPALFFDEGTMLFTTEPDSAERCSFASPDTTCTGIASLNILESNYRCGPFSKIEVRTYYTSSEKKLYGDSLAQERAQACIRWLENRGMKNVDFVVVPILYSTRPLKNPDGTIRKEETSLISFRILEW